MKSTVTRRRPVDISITDAISRLLILANANGFSDGDKQALQLGAKALECINSEALVTSTSFIRNYAPMSL